MGINERLAGIEFGEESYDRLVAAGYAKDSADERGITFEGLRVLGDLLAMTMIQMRQSDEADEALAGQLSRLQLVALANTADMLRNVDTAAFRHELAEELIKLGTKFLRG